jgi:hypothetical protein
MKSVRVIFLVLILALTVPLSSAVAQDDGNTDVEPVIAAVYYIPASGGSFAAEGDGYLLTLSDVASQVAWIMSKPSLILQQHDTANLAAQWGVAQDLMTDAVLEVNGWNIQMTLGSPTYENGTLTFMAYNPEIVAPGVKEPELPTTFGSASLSVLWTLEFQQSMISAVFESEGIRTATTEECDAAKAEWDTYWTWLNTKLKELNKYAVPCKIMHDANACAQLTAISDEIAAEYAKVSYLPDYLNQECGIVVPN